LLKLVFLARAWSGKPEGASKKKLQIDAA